MLALMSLVVSSTIWSLVGILTALGSGLNRSCPLDEEMVLVVSKAGNQNTRLELYPHCKATNAINIKIHLVCVT